MFGMFDVTKRGVMTEEQVSLHIFGFALCHQVAV